MHCYGLLKYKVVPYQAHKVDPGPAHKVVPGPAHNVNGGIDNAMAKRKGKTVKERFT
jgi:hypothetical protein